MLAHRRRGNPQQVFQLFDRCRSLALQVFDDLPERRLAPLLIWLIVMGERYHGEIILSNEYVFNAERTIGLSANATTTVAVEPAQDGSDQDDAGQGGSADKDEVSKVGESRQEVCGVLLAMCNASIAAWPLSTVVGTIPQ